MTPLEIPMSGQAKDWPASANGGGRDRFAGVQGQCQSGQVYVQQVRPPAHASVLGPEVLDQHASHLPFAKQSTMPLSSAHGDGGAGTQQK